MFALPADVAVSSASRLKGKDCKKLRAAIADQLHLEDPAAFDELFPAKVSRCACPPPALVPAPTRKDCDALNTNVHLHRAALRP